MVSTCQDNKEVALLYITQTQNAARNILWGELLSILTKFEIDCKTDHTRLTVTFPNNSKIYLAGAKDQSEVSKFRGYKLKKCYIDEAQSIRPSILTELINDVIIPALRDLRGALYLTGTPGPTCTGPYYKYSQSKDWDSQHWTAFDNPHMHNPDKGLDLNETLNEECIIRGIDKSDPSFIRESYGQWIEDKDSLVFRFDRSINIYNHLPIQGEWTYIMGVDYGYDDSDAIVVIGYNSHEKKIYLIEEFEKSKQNITELITSIKKYKDKYNPVKIVCDSGALGKKITSEIVQRHHIVLEAAEKSRKIEFIELLNDDLRTGKLQVPRGSKFEEDCMLVSWDKDSKIRNPENPKISDTYHSDITDALLYAWKASLHYLSEAPIVEPKLNTNEYMDKIEQQEADKMQRRKEDPMGANLEESFEEDCNELDFIADVYYNDL